MTARPLTAADLDWLVARLQRRRVALAPHAPVFWHPAPDAASRHRAYLGGLLEGGAVGVRTDDSVLVAAQDPAGWLVDDAAATSNDWPVLWQALASRCAPEQVRVVCPVVEPERRSFVEQQGLTLHESWWLLELPDSGGGPPGETIDLPGARAVTVAAPPVYRPPGPVLFLSSVDDAADAVAAAVRRAPGLGCSAVVVAQPAGDAAPAPVLGAAGFRRHCDFLAGALRPR